MFKNINQIDKILKNAAYKIRFYSFPNLNSNENAVCCFLDLFSHFSNIEIIVLESFPNQNKINFIF